MSSRSKTPKAWPAPAPSSTALGRYGYCTAATPPRSPPSRGALAPYALVPRATRQAPLKLRAQFEPRLRGSAGFEGFKVLRERGAGGGELPTRLRTMLTRAPALARGARERRAARTTPVVVARAAHGHANARGRVFPATVQRRRHGAPYRKPSSAPGALEPTIDLGPEITTRNAVGLRHALLLPALLILSSSARESATPRARSPSQAP